MTQQLTGPNSEQQHLPLHRLYLAVASSVLTVIITVIVARFGYIDLSAAVTFVGMTALVSGIFYALIRTGFNLRFSDPSLTAAQIITAGIVTSYPVFASHAARPAFMIFYLTAFMFGVFVLQMHKLVQVALFLLFCYACAVGLALILRPDVNDISREVFRFAILAGLLGWLTALGNYVQILQKRLKTANVEVTRLLREQRLVFDTATVGIMLLREREIVDCNIRLATMFGYSRDELLGKSPRLLFADEADWRVATDEANKTLLAGQAAKRAIAMRTKAGLPIVCDAAMDSLFPGDPVRGVVLILNDITVAKLQESSLRKALFEQLAIFNNAPAGIVFVRNRNIEDCNQFMTKLVGEPYEDIVGKNAERWFQSREAREKRRRETNAAFARRESYSYEEHFVRKDGSRFWCRVHGGLVDASDPDNPSAVFVLVDITERVDAIAELRQSREMLEMVIRAAKSGIWDFNLADRKIVFSARFLEILGYPGDTDPSTVMPVIERVHAEDRERIERSFREHIRSHVPLQGDFRLKKANGEYVWVSGHGEATWNESGRATRVVGSIDDISHAKDREEEVHRMAMHDVLTSLPNRRLLEDRLDHALATARRENKPLAVMLLDLDGFKSVNDSHGHAAGDIVLNTVAVRLRACIRESDTVARTGGDEFVVLVENFQGGVAVARLAEKLLNCVHESISVGEHIVQIGVSIGISSYPLDSDQPAQLIRMADKAMYRVKETGRNGFRFHSAKE